MARTLQFRRGTSAEISNITGAEGEIFIDLDKNAVVVMDGSTQGGQTLQSELVSGTNIKTVNGETLLGSGDVDFTTSLALVGNELRYTNIDGTVQNIDLSPYLDDTTNTIVSGVLSGNTITFTREDATTFTVDVSALYDDTNLVTSVNGDTGNVTVQETLVSGTNIKTVNGETLLGSGDIDFTTSLALVGDSLNYTNIDGTVQSIDLSPYLDDTTNTIVSGVLSGNTITFTREDATTFTVDVSALYDDTNLVTSVNGDTGDVVVQETLVSGTNIKTVNGETLLGSGDIDFTTSLALNSNSLDYTNIDGTVQSIDLSAYVNVGTDLGSSGTGNTRTITSSTGGNTSISYSAADVGALAIDGTADAASRLETARTVSLSGDVSGSIDFDGSADVTITTTIQPDSVVLGTDTTGDYVAGANAGSGITISGTVGQGWSPTISHADTSSQTSVDNAGGTVIQDITLDDFGHITSINSTDLDSRYYTESEADNRFVNADGDTLTGFLTLHADPTQSLHAVTKRYVDEVAQGLQALPAAKGATEANLSATYNNGSSGVGSTLTSTVNGSFPTIDGVSYSLGDNILVKDQTDATENGSYVLTTVGDASNPWVLTRCTFCDEPDDLAGAFEFIINGTTYGGTGWVLIAESPVTIGTTELNWTQFSGAGTYTAGTGLDLNGTQFTHADTSSVSDVNNSNNTFIQDLTFDTFGHVTGATSGTVVVNDGTLTVNTSGVGLAGSGTFSANQSANNTITITSNATSENTGSAIVARDSSGNFSAGTITASLSGNADTATALQTSRTITLTGDVSGSAGFDGSANITITATVADDSHNHTVANIDGLQDDLDSKQETLVSGTNIKTVNGETLLGSGDVDLTTSLTLVGNELRYTNIDGTLQTIDLSAYLDDTTNTVMSGTVDAETGIATFTRDDDTTFTVDFSALFDDTNLTRITSGTYNSSTSTLSLVRGGDGTQVDVDLSGLSGLTLADVTGNNATTTDVVTFVNGQTTGNITGYGANFIIAPAANQAVLLGKESTGGFSYNDADASLSIASTGTITMQGASGAEIVIGTGTSGKVTIGSGTNTVEFLSGSTVDFTGTTITGTGFLTTETNDLTSAVTWANVPDSNITESSVTQHQAALSIVESQISFTSSFIELGDLSVTQNSASGNGALSYSNVSGVFTYTPPDLSGFLTAETNDLTSAVTWANVPDANITESSVTQHQAALSITESQISNLQSYLVSSDLNGYATETYVNNTVSNLVDSAPATLDTLNELAAALGDDPNFATTISNQLGNKANTSTTISAGTGLTGGGSLDANRTISLNHLGIQNLSDPNDDRIAFWDESAGSFQWLDLGANLNIGGTTINATNTDTTYSPGTLLDLSGTTFNVDLSELVTSTANGDGDFFVVVDSGNNQRKLTKSNIDISGFNNDAGYTTNVGDITNVSAGTGLSGGGSSGSVTVSLSHLGIQNLSDPNSDRIAFWDDSSGSFQWLAVGTGLSISGTTISSTVSGATVAEKSDSVTYNVIFTDETSGNHENSFVNSSVLTFNASTGTLTSTDFDSLSDERYKENIQTVDNASDIVADLTGRSFTWKESQKPSYGVIAQELEQVVPELVTEGDDGTKRVNYNGLLAFLIESNKELQKRVQELEQKVK